MKRKIISAFIVAAAAFGSVYCTAFAEVKDLSSYCDTSYWADTKQKYIDLSSDAKSTNDSSKKLKGTTTVSEDGDGNKTCTTVAVETVKSADSYNILWANYGLNPGDASTMSARANKTIHFEYIVTEASTDFNMSVYGRKWGNNSELVNTSAVNVLTFGENYVTCHGKTVDGLEAGYKIDVFQNAWSHQTIVYVNGSLLYNGIETSDADLMDKSLVAFRAYCFRVAEEQSDGCTLSLTNVRTELYNKDIPMADVAQYNMGEESPVETDYLWRIEGINTGYSNHQGAMSNAANGMVTGNNTDGYVLTASTINASHYGFARYMFGPTSSAALTATEEDRVVWQSYYYNPTNLTTGQLFEVRGGTSTSNAYQTIFRAEPANGDAPAYLALGSSGAKICDIDSDNFYKIDLIINNKSGSGEYYLFVDGMLAAHDAIWATRFPLWQTVFSSKSEGESMTLKNMTTTVYEPSVSIYNIVAQVANDIYVDLTDFVYDTTDQSLTATAVLFGNSDAFEEGQLIYAAYDETGQLVASSVDTADNSIVNTDERGRSYPYGVLDLSNVADETSLTVKAYLWSDYAHMMPLCAPARSGYKVNKGSPVDIK